MKYPIGSICKVGRTRIADFSGCIVKVVDRKLDICQVSALSGSPDQVARLSRYVGFWESELEPCSELELILFS